MDKEAQLDAAKRVRDQFVQELTDIYNNRTMGDYTFEGALYHFMVNYQQETGIQVFP